MSTTNTLSMSKEMHNQRIGNHYCNIAIGVLGMLIASYANLLSHGDTQKLSYLISAVLLLLSSILERQKFFIALQIIIVSGTLIAFAPIGVFLKASVPILLSMFAIIYFIATGQWKDRVTGFGCLGIAILAVGYAVTNPVIYFLGAFILAIYSFISYRRGITIALVWAILNVMFAITAAVGIYKMLLL